MDYGYEIHNKSRHSNMKPARGFYIGAFKRCTKEEPLL